jgi:hypothetical protein
MSIILELLVGVSGPSVLSYYASITGKVAAPTLPSTVKLLAF